MKITEIEWVDGKKYKDENKLVWLIQDGELLKVDHFERVGEILTSFKILQFYRFKDVVKLEFEEILDWSKIKIDTKILVSVNGEVWTKRHFAKYENGLIYTFANSGSSWTEDKLAGWKYGKLPN